MRGRIGLALVVGACGVVLYGCGGAVGSEPSEVDPSGDAPALAATPTAEVPLLPTPPAPPLTVAPALVLNGEDTARPAPPPPPFQPAFHQALRWSRDIGTLTTFRLFVPVGRAGERVRFTFRSGDSTLTLQRATVARAGPNGTLASAPVPMTFSGSPGFNVDRRTRVTSDALAFPVGFREELAVTFEVRGSVAASAINSFPNSTARAGALATSTGALGGERYEVSVGLATIEVEGPPTRVFVAIGDSITEGYYDTYNDYRKAWPALTESQLGVPVLNAGVSGQGLWEELQNLEQEVLSLKGVTDCVILLGTNDLAGLTDTEMQGRMTTLFNRLEPFCRLWVSTLLPKEKSNHGDYEEVKRGRLAVNAWIRQLQRATVVDLEAVTRQPGNVHLFIDGLEVDGIHPSPQGHKVMADEVVRAAREKWKK
jgi:lysophospholipase L1-like esterase